MDQKQTLVNRLIASAVFLFVFISYYVISSPSLSFWDCSEYVAAAVSLGVPHPPGNPFFMLLGRTATVLLGFIPDVARRITMIDVLMGAFTAMLVYLTVVRILTSLTGSLDTRWKQLTVYVGGVTGSLFAAFSNTVLFSMVESEVNGPLLLPIMLTTWLVMVWSQSTGSRRDRLLLLIAYIAYLGIGIHMYSMITLGPIFLFVIIIDRDKLKDWRLWMTASGLGVVIYSTSLFITLSVVLLVVTLLGLLVDRPNRPRWNFCFWMVVLAQLGFSTHVYLPIRSTLNPVIDENHPATWQAFQDYLERKQYGSESMIERMFWRRGSWGHQFGVEGHMGFGGFYMTQFFRFSPLDTEQSLFATNEFGTALFKLLLYLIPIGLTFWAMFYLWRRNWRHATLLITLELMTTVVLVLYMNFADGTRAERSDYRAWERSGRQGPMPTVHREVRVRDYFYIAGFMFHGLWVGVAAGSLMFFLFTNRRRFLRTTIAPVSAMLWLISPALPFAQNMPLNDRRYDLLPWDYAYNLLMSCEREGILFTNGDNDTFPLWALQEAYGVRRDVRIVNLSLLNTDWYIKQLRDFDPKVPITFTDRQIANLQPELNPFEKTVNYKLQDAGITVTIPGRSQKHAMLVQDKMVLNIINANRWSKPVYFSTTVASEHFMGSDPYLQMQGLVFRLLPQEVPDADKFDLERSLYLLTKVYRFRGLGQRTAVLEGNAQALVSNYAACFMQTAYVQRRVLDDSRRSLERLMAMPATERPAAQVDSVRSVYEENLAQAMMIMDQAVSLMPWDWRPRYLRHELLVGQGKVDLAAQHVQEALAIEPTNQGYLKMDSQLRALGQYRLPDSLADPAAVQ